MISPALHSSASVEYGTPIRLFRELEHEFGKFDLDPCATKLNAKCGRFFTKEQDGLTQEWTGRVFVNPPYGRRVGLWVRKAYDSARLGSFVVCLVPARTDTDWWHEAVEGKASEVRFVRGRIKFSPAQRTAPFPSVVIVYRPIPRVLVSTGWRRS